MKDHEAAANNWMTSNPGVMKTFEKFALLAKQSGRRKIGMQLLIERVRWYGTVEKREEDFKINNNYAAYIARALMQINPALEGFFEIRQVGIPR